MTFRYEALARIVEARLIAVIRADSAAEAIVKGRAVVSGGIQVLEVAFTTPNATSAITALKDEMAQLPSPPLIGAGTVLDGETAVLALQAGAQFLVSPVVVVDVIRAAARHGAAVVPGAATPTEILHALESGADLVKIFPAETLGIPFLRALRPAIPQAGLVPTGGIDAENAPMWLEAGAVAVGVGGWLTKGSPSEVERRAAALVAATGAAARQVK